MESFLSLHSQVDQPSQRRQRNQSKSRSPLYDWDFLSPVVIRRKFLFQELCELKLEWDEPLTGVLLTKWESMVADLQADQQILIPRYFLHDAGHRSSQQGSWCVSVGERLPAWRSTSLTSRTRWSVSTHRFTPKVFCSLAATFWAPPNIVLEYISSECSVQEGLECPAFSYWRMSSCNPQEFVLNLRRSNSPACSKALDSQYIVRASSSVSAPLTTSST